jgi:hypothetical protein
MAAALLYAMLSIQGAVQPVISNQWPVISEGPVISNQWPVISKSKGNAATDY